MPTRFIGSLFVLIIILSGLDNKYFGGNAKKPDWDTANSSISYGQLLYYAGQDWIQRLDFYQNNRIAILEASSPELGNKTQLIRVEIPLGISQFIQTLKDLDIDFDSHPIPIAKKSIYTTIATNILVPILFICGLALLLGTINAISTLSSTNNMAESTARFNYDPATNISFDDIAGIDEAQEEFEEIISFLKEPERYTIVGAKIPKGVLLVGPPGTGKTLLAKAIASEAEVPFFSTAGSEFVEMFIGVGASRVRDLFTKASKKTPCLVFIDEIDAVGRKRGAGIGGGNDEREQTLNQLLTEMDGFKDNKGVIVIGATNRVDILDDALIRPGRFDRRITVGLPDREGRLAILKVHSRNKPISDEVSLRNLANRTTGFSGADLANLLNEAAILATRYKKDKITRDEIDEAIDRVVGGITGSIMEATSQKRLIAYHEIGHALIGTLSQFHDDIEKVTLIPRGNAKGYTWFSPASDSSFITRIELFSRIVTLLGGRVIEKIVFGDPNVTTGAANDISQVTMIARNIVTQYGMSSIGPVALENENNQLLFESVTNQISMEVKSIIDHCEKLAVNIVEENRVLADYLVEELLQFETMDGKQFRQMVNEYTSLPVKFKDFRNSYYNFNTFA